MSSAWSAKARADLRERARYYATQSVRKITPITEKVGTEFRAEFFNLPNHANWGVPGVSGLGNSCEVLAVPASK
jgi:plasmid stabilization system protein ParE